MKSAQDQPKGAEALKRAAAQSALSLVEPGMTLGLGTGSTAAHFIELLGARPDLDVGGVATSSATRALAEKAGVAVVEPDETTKLDLAVDGADEIDPALNLIKGGGGALLLEKIVAANAKRFVVIADASKYVERLGTFPLPVEIETTYWPMTVRAVRGALRDLGWPDAALTLRGRGAGFTAGPAFTTDGGNYIVDCALGAISDPPAVARALSAIPGVVETGLFIDLANEALIAGPEGVSRVASATG